MTDVSRSTSPQEPSSSPLARWDSWSSDLHESLASQAASAAELHQDLEDLRRSMDGAPAVAAPPEPALGPSGQTPPGAHRARRHRSRSLLVGAAGVVVALAVAGTATLATRSRSAASTDALTGSTKSVETPTTTASSRGLPLPAWPGQNVSEPPGLPAHGVGVDVSGTEVTAAISAGQAVDVYERVLMPGTTRTLTVRPAASRALADSLGSPLPVVQDVHAAVRGRPVPVTKTGSGWTLNVPGAAAVDHVVLRYRLTGALIRHEPSPPGRYMLVLTPLAPSAGGDDAVVVRVRDPRVQELYCPAASDSLCGRAEGELHTATVPAGTVPVVVALVTFPR